jgi:N-glycosylase/DNA lyase
MNMYSSTPDGFKIKDFDIRHTMESAQPLTFHADYESSKGIINYTTDKHLIKINFSGDNKNCHVKLQSDNISTAKKEFVKRFRLNDNMKEIYSHIETDKFMNESVKRYRGMHLTLSDPWETTLCFIISQYNNVKRIRLITKRFVSEFGREITDRNGNLVGRSFPTSKDLLNFGEKEFRLCGAGFRAKYIASAAEYCTNNLDLYKLKNKSYENVKGELMKISGVGDKVADCISLMGYGKMKAFPIDVWVKRTLENVYFKGKKKSIKDLHKFVEEQWDNKYLGYAQQYIFWGGRNIR